MRKQYTLTFEGRVQEVGFRGHAQDLCRRLGIGGVIYNAGANAAKVLCEGEERSIKRFYREIQQYSLAEIREAKIEEGIQLPYPIHRAVLGIEEELYTRLDIGVRLLETIKEDTALLRDIHEDTRSLGEGVKGTTEGIKGVRNDLKTLQRIEKILGKISQKL